MKFLDEFQFSDNEFGIQVVVCLGEGWKDAARKFPVKEIDRILKPSVAFATRRLREMQQIPELACGEYGLHHIHLMPERAGMDLFPDQNKYISHNLARGDQVAAVLPILSDYLKLLEYAQIT